VPIVSLGPDTEINGRPHRRVGGWAMGPTVTGHYGEQDGLSALSEPASSGGQCGLSVGDHLTQAERFVAALDRGFEDRADAS
jgi:hypothetical protein